MKPTVAVIALAAFSATAHAATLVGGVVAAPNSTAGTSYTMPSGTGTDWGFFNKDNTSVASPFNATNTSGTGARVFAVSTFNGGSLRGPGNATTGAPLSFFNYNNGTTPVNSAAGTDSRPTGIFNTQLGSTGVGAGPTGDKGSGVQFSVTGFSAQSLVSVWLFNFAATGVVEVFLNGSTNLLYTQQVTNPPNPTDGKNAYLLTLNFTPDNATDELLIRYRMTATDDATNGHVGLQAVAISPIPEPASLALLALAGGAFGFRRRR